MSTLKQFKSTRQKRQQLLAIRNNMVHIQDNMEMIELIGPVMDSMKSALRAMRLLSKGKNINEIDDMMAEFGELVEESNAIGDALAAMDDSSGSSAEDFEQEFARIEEELKGHQQQQTPAPTFPGVPTEIPFTSTTQSKSHVLLSQ
jgi:predicted  nucleic acid-binding Zn-ribbon protein